MSGQLERQEPLPRECLSAPKDRVASSACVCTTAFLPFPTGKILVVWVAGEVDLSTLPVLQEALRRSLGHRPAHLVIDLAQLQYCSARGIAMLVQAGLLAAERNVGYALSGLSPHLDRIWNKVWGSDLPARYRTVATAVAAVRATIPVATIPVATLHERQAQIRDLYRWYGAEFPQSGNGTTDDDGGTGATGDHQPDTHPAHAYQAQSSACSPQDGRPPLLADGADAAERSSAQVRQRRRLWLGLDIPEERPC